MLLVLDDEVTLLLDDGDDIVETPGVKDERVEEVEDDIDGNDDDKELVSEVVVELEERDFLFCTVANVVPIMVTLLLGSMAL